MGVNNLYNNNNKFINLNIDKDKYNNQIIQGIKGIISKSDSKTNNDEQFFFNNF